MDKARPFLKRTFRKEVNALTRKATKQNVLAILATKVQREQDKSARRPKAIKKESQKGRIFGFRFRFRGIRPRD
jgi:hypothetical protein